VVTLDLLEALMSDPLVPDAPDASREDRPVEESDAVPDTPNTDPDEKGRGEHDEEHDRVLRERWESSLERSSGSAADAEREDNNQDQIFTESERERLRLMGVL
jgi:hypothetical protein